MTDSSSTLATKPRRNLWPIGIISVFVVFITATVSLVVFACSQKVDLVSDDYYEQEIRFQNHLDRANRAQALVQAAAITCDASANRVQVTLPQPLSTTPLAGVIKFYRPSAAGLDRDFPLQLDAAGRQSLDVSAMAAGYWKIRVLWTADEKDYFAEQRVFIGKTGAPKL
jgi:hypothetical protein